MPLRLLAILWALPYTLLGMFLGMIGLCTGGRARIRGRVIEFYGGGVKWLLQQFFFGEGAMAFTLGHTVLGQTDAALDISRQHELVHVRQFERLGAADGTRLPGLLPGALAHGPQALPRQSLRTPGIRGVILV